MKNKLDRYVTDMDGQVSLVYLLVNLVFNCAGISEFISNVSLAVYVLELTTNHDENLNNSL